MTKDEILEKAKEVIRIEREAVEGLLENLNDSFYKAVEIIYNSTGRVIVTGIGKSGIIGKKIAATLTSTGTPALFLHPAEGVHGDLGMVRKDDVILCISKSGNTEELYQLLPLFKRIGVPIISMVGNMNSALAKSSDIVIDISVKEEACPHDLAPTASTTATLAMGDALAITLLHKRNFTKEDFAFIHPGGSLGKKLLLKVDDIAHSHGGLPIVSEEASIQEAILEITSKRYGATCVINKQSGKLVGIITDGDLRRLLEKKTDISDINAKEAMTKNPKVINKDELAAKAMNIMETHNIMQIIVVDEEHKPIGMIHLHDLLKVGLT